MNAITQYLQTIPLRLLAIHLTYIYILQSLFDTHQGLLVTLYNGPKMPTRSYRVIAIMRVIP